MQGGWYTHTRARARTHTHTHTHTHTGPRPKTQQRGNENAKPETQTQQDGGGHETKPGPAAAALTGRKFLRSPTLASRTHARTHARTHGAIPAISRSLPPCPLHPAACTPHTMHRSMSTSQLGSMGAASPKRMGSPGGYQSSSDKSETSSGAESEVMM